MSKIIPLIEEFYSKLYAETGEAKPIADIRLSANVYYKLCKEMPNWRWDINIFGKPDDDSYFVYKGLLRISKA